MKKFHMYVATLCKMTASTDKNCDDCWFGDFTPCLTITGPDAPGRTAHVIYEQPLGDACVPR